MTSELSDKPETRLGHASASNSCLVPSNTDDTNAETLSRRVKDYLKGFRPLFRWIYGYRALRDGLKAYARGKRGAGDYLKTSLSFMAGSEKILGRPMNITLEPTNACNLACPVCETGARSLGRATGHLSMKDFKTLVDKIAPHTNTLLFYYMGEPFLNRESYDMIRYAKDQGIPYINTCTNGDFADGEKLVTCGLDEVSFQIGGMSQETHQTYRINSNFERVMKNLKAALDARRRTGSKIQIDSGFILMKHNEHEVPLFQKTMKDLGVDNALVIDPCVRDMEQGRLYLPSDKNHWFYDPKAYEKGLLKPRFLPPNACPWIYYSLTVHVNGNVVPCCRDPRGEYVIGNLLTQSIDEVWNSPAAQAFRRQLHQDQGKISICKLCSSYSPPPMA